MALASCFYGTNGVLTHFLLLPEAKASVSFGVTLPEAKASVSFGEMIFQRLRPSEKTDQGKI
jgi:hypothetical protein